MRHGGSLTPEPEPLLGRVTCKGRIVDSFLSNRKVGFQVPNGNESNWVHESQNYTVNSGFRRSHLSNFENPSSPLKSLPRTPISGSLHPTHLKPAGTPTGRASPEFDRRMQKQATKQPTSHATRATRHATRQALHATHGSRNPPPAFFPRTSSPFHTLFFGFFGV